MISQPGGPDDMSNVDDGPETTACLTVQNLTRPGLGPISFALGRGECLTVSGPSGAGKTLLLRAIADLDPNTGGVALGTEDRKTMPAPHWRRRVAYVPTEPGWWADTVGEHFPDWSAAGPQAAALGLPTDCDGWTVQRLSTGERQRLGLLRALVHNPEVLLLDEPTSGLDAEANAAVESIIGQIRRERGTGVVWVTHDGAQAARVATKRLTIENGRCR